MKCGGLVGRVDEVWGGLVGRVDEVCGASGESG